MKKRIQFLTFFGLFFLYGPINGQVFPWTAPFGGPGADFATDIKQTSDNGYIIAGYGGDGFSANYYVVKLNEYGLLQWERNLSKDNYAERAYSVVATSDGGFVVIGTATQMNRPWLVKLDSNGDTLWTSQWTSTLPQNSALLARGAELPDGRIVVIGAEGSYGYQPNMFLVSQNGELTEQRTLNAIVPPGWLAGTFVSHIENTADGGFVLTGSAGSGTGTRPFIWKFDQNADSVWSVHFTQQGVWMRSAESIKQLSDGGYILSGYTAPNSEHSCALRADANGNLLWFSSFPDTIYTQATDVIEWTDGKFLITEKRFNGFGETFFQTALLTVDSEGSLLNREMIMASDSSTTITRMRRTSDGGFVMAGEINEYLVVNEQDLFVLKSDAEGNISGAGIDYVWPGDINYDGTVNMDDLMILGVTAGAAGPPRVDQSIGWYPHYVTNWADTVVTGVNYKHADTDGNGIVDIHDTLAIITNYGLTRDLDNRRYVSSLPTKSTRSGNDLFIIPEEVMLIDAVNVEIPLYLGEAATPVIGFYGMRFSMATDPTLVVAESMTVDFTGSWLGTQNTDLWAIQKTFADEGATDLGLTLNNHQPVSGFGQIGFVKFSLAQPLQHGEVLNLEIHFDNLMAYEYDLTPIELSTGTFQIVLDNNLTGMDDLVFNDKIHVFPNPVAAGHPVIIHSNKAISTIEIYSIAGLLVASEKFDLVTQQFTAPAEKGIYLLKIYTTSGITTKRLIVN
ncbi:MAG: T9SS type A sorting domain-containing protein [Bacteroidales bacterium]|nr:T9SS type A sorting domain-containing protein [Bacteroidales bacterium]